jgi:hypothetical protein
MTPVTFLQDYPILCKPFVGGNQQAPFALCHHPQRVILHPLIWGAANITHVMAQQTKCLHSH